MTATHAAPSGKRLDPGRDPAWVRDADRADRARVTISVLGNGKGSGRVLDGS
jgi:hypothetical protein